MRPTISTPARPFSPDGAMDSTAAWVVGRSQAPEGWIGPESADRSETRRSSCSRITSAAGQGELPPIGNLSGAAGPPGAIPVAAARVRASASAGAM